MPAPPLPLTGIFCDNPFQWIDQARRFISAGAYVHTVWQQTPRLPTN